MDQNNYNNGFDNQNNSTESTNVEQVNTEQIVSSYNNYYSSGVKNSKFIVLVCVLIFLLTGALIFGVNMFLSVETTKMVNGYRDQTMVRAFKEEINKVYISTQNQYLTESVTGDLKAFELSISDTYKCYLYDLDSLGLAGINKAGGYYGTVALCLNTETNKMDYSGVALSNGSYHTDGFVLISSNLSDDIVKEGSNIDSVVYLKDNMNEIDKDRLIKDLSLLFN